MASLARQSFFLPAWIFLLSFAAFSSADIIDVSMQNFNTTVTKIYFSILFLADKDCEKCDSAYPKFMAASQPFTNDPQILFGRVTDPLLFQAMNVTKFPSLVYYAPGSATPEISQHDMTVEGIITTIAEAMKGDFSRVKREYAAELTEDVYDEFVAIPGVYGLILVYENNKDSKEHVEIFEKIAKTFQNDYLITFGKVNARAEKSLASDFTVSRFPGLYWYPKENKNSRKRYGGILEEVELVTFINDQTRLMRLPGGELEEFAGCVPQIDSLIVKHIKAIHDGKGLQPFIKQLSDFADTESGKYYLHIVNGLQKAGSMDYLEEERGEVLKQLSARGISPIAMDSLRKRQNILHKFIDELSVYMVNRDGIYEMYEMPHQKTIMHEEL